MLRVCVRYYQKLRHPQTFPQLVQLTDGSTIQVRAISPKRPFIQLPIDSMTHPSWIGTRGNNKNAGFTDEQGRLAKFNARFGGFDDIVEIGAQNIAGFGKSIVLTESTIDAHASKKDGKGKGKKGKKK